MIALLEPIFQGPLAMHGEKLACSASPPPAAIPVVQLLDGSPALERLVHRYARHWRCTGPDLRAAASAWSMAYFDALLPPVCAAATLLHHVFPLRARDVAVIVNDEGAAQSFHIRDPGAPRHGAAPLERYESLVWDHLDPLFHSLQALTRLPRKILWSNCARHLEAIFDVARSLAAGNAAIDNDRRVLLNDATWPDRQPGGAQCPNPFFGRERVILLAEAGRPAPHRLHRQCCLYYKLPGVDYCGACPLDPRHRGQPSEDRAPELIAADGERDELYDPGS
ncbi:MAG: siderophore-iron reductase FhuF [Burkholderiaceae bacterium]